MIEILSTFNYNHRSAYFCTLGELTVVSVASSSPVDQGELWIVLVEGHDQIGVGLPGGPVADAPVVVLKNRLAGSIESSILAVLL